MFKISLLSNYHVKYYEYIVKWCSGVSCNWCVSLDIGLILALIMQLQSFYLRNLLCNLIALQLDCKHEDIDRAYGIEWDDNA